MRKILIVLALLAAACNKRPIQPELSAVAIDTLLVAGKNSYEVAYDFASIVNAAKSPALEAIERANIGYFFGLEEFSGTLQEAIETSLSQLAEEIHPTEGASAELSLQHYEQSASSEATVADTLLTYTITQSSYTGGAHDTYGVSFHTYSIVSGLELVLNDLFTQEQIGSLDRLIRQKIYREYGETDDEGLIRLGFFPEYIAANENFCIAPNGEMTFYYNLYEIGCYALGPVEVTITPEELKTL